MVGTHDGSDWIGEVRAFNNIGADGRVDLHLFEFVGSQPAGLGKNVLRYRQLADVMQQRRRPQSLQFGIADLHDAADLNGVSLHPFQMAGRGGVLGFNRQRQRLNRAHVQSRQFLGMAQSVVHPRKVQLIGSGDQVNKRQYEERKLPPNTVRKRSKTPGHCRAAHGVGQGPKAAFPPGRDHPPPFGPGDGDGNRDCMHQEERQRRRRQP